MRFAAKRPANALRSNPNSFLALHLEFFKMKVSRLFLSVYVVFFM